MYRESWAFRVQGFRIEEGQWGVGIGRAVGRYQGLGLRVYGGWWTAICRVVLRSGSQAFLGSPKWRLLLKFSYSILNPEP